MYWSFVEAVKAGENVVQGIAGGGRGFPEGMVPSARDVDEGCVVRMG